MYSISVRGLQQRVRLRDPLGDGTAAHEVFAHDAFATFGRDPAVPHALGIDDHPWPAEADAEARRFRTQRGNVHFLQLRLEPRPRGEASLGCTAVGPDT